MPRRETDAAPARGKKAWSGGSAVLNYGTISGGTISGGTISGGTISGGTISGSRYNEIVAILDPRVFRVGVRIEF